MMQLIESYLVDGSDFPFPCFFLDEDRECTPRMEPQRVPSHPQCWALHLHEESIIVISHILIQSFSLSGPPPYIHPGHYLHFTTEMVEPSWENVCNVPILSLIHSPGGTCSDPRQQSICVAWMIHVELHWQKTAQNTMRGIKTLRIGTSCFNLFKVVEDLSTMSTSAVWSPLDLLSVMEVAGGELDSSSNCTC